MKTTLAFSLTFILSFIFTYTSINACAENSENTKKGGRLIGVVTDYQDKHPLEYANVVLLLKSDSTIVTGTITDSKGAFSINEIDYNKYFLKIEYIGYAPFYIDTIVLNENNKILDLGIIYIKNSFLNISEVTVEAEKNMYSYKFDKKIINISQNPNAQGSTIYDVLLNTPSITTDNNGNVLLRGNNNFTLLIDGKPTTLSVEDIIKSMPASMIETIEVITNPSAKYSAEGTSGIINLISKKNIIEGVAGLIEIGYSIKNKYNTNGIMNINKSKFKITISPTFNSNPMNSYNSFTRYLNNDERTIIKDSTLMWFNRVRNSFSSSIEYNINEKNNISASFNVGEFKFMRNIDIFYCEIDDNNNHIFSSGKNEFDVKSNYYNFNLFYDKNFGKKGHNISILLYTSLYDINTNGNSKTFNNDLYWQLLNINSDVNLIELGKGNENKIKIDYRLPLNEKFNFESGVHLSLKQINSDKFIEDYDFTQNSWTPNDKYISNSDFSKNINSIYSSINGDIFKNQIQVGLRIENIVRILSLNNISEEYNYKNIHFFPNLSLSRELCENKQIQVSYSKRIRHPEDWLLNPTPNYSDSYSIEIGNPNLKPEISNSYEFNYIYKLNKGIFSSGLFYRNTFDAITRTSQVYNNDTMIFTSLNFGKSDFCGLEINSNYNISKQVSLNFMSSIFYSNYYGFLGENYVKNSGYSYNINLSPLLKISKHSKLQIVFNYQSSGHEPMTIVEPNFITNITYKHEFLKRKLSVAISISDVFNTGKYEVKTFSKAYNSHLYWKNESQVVRFSLTYSINNYQKKSYKYESNEQVI